MSAKTTGLSSYWLPQWARPKPHSRIVAKRSEFSEQLAQHDPYHDEWVELNLCNCRECWGSPPENTPKAITPPLTHRMRVAE